MRDVVTFIAPIHAYSIESRPYRTDGGWDHSMSARSKCSVYIVEDDFLVAILLQDFAKQLGFMRVEHYATYNAAQAAIATSAPDLCFLDVKLGDKLSFGIAEQLQSNNVPFIFTTGFGNDAIPKEWRKRPRLNKPFAIENVQSILTELSFSE